MARLLYSLLMTLLLPLLLGRLWWRGRKNPGYRSQVWQRLGLIARQPQPGSIWIHAVSVGETIAAAPLIEALLQTYPQRRLWITSTTPTGAAQVQRLFGDRVGNSFMPYDIPLFWRWFGGRLQPACLIVMETELWPNLLAWTSRHQIPSLLANARLSAKSARGYQKFAALTRPMLQRLDWVAAQNPVDGQRFVELGLPEERLQITGSIKFDVAIPADIQRQAQQLRQQWGSERPVLLLASSHAGEDELLLAAWQQLRQQWPELLLLLVPRHPERFDAVAALAQQAGCTVARRSDVSAGDQPQLFVGDSMGEMLLYLAAADLVVMGGSLVERGGHNPIEPAALGKPVLMGPHYFNFQLIVDQMVAAGALQLTAVETLAADLAALLENPQQARQMGQHGLQLVEQSRGVVERLVKITDRLLSSGPCMRG
ncbi:lipid IV(A) 3-deoxy-D-manno-octulosonic acid transferase [Oceanobacter mangrovi]|uniref:lipid IV(A) 3-deoxy-D-manno-octulosonic acid transferase n=1 Tax=Oceanobacter mangrovi TaxID=2862510 RepID=UPI001C8E83C9|nr:lipid IV(A) 3-deoxy-D-manno-octulosonic acid transferase [Oceanobacter mangrovi]